MESLVKLDDKYIGVQVEKVIISLFFELEDKIKINNNNFKLDNVYQDKDLNLTLIDISLVPDLKFVNIKDNNEDLIGKVINFKEHNNVVIGKRRYRKSEVIPYLEIKHNNINGILLNNKREFVSILVDEKRAIPIDIIQKYYHFIIKRKQNVIKKRLLPFKFINLNNEFIVIESEIENINMGWKMSKINDTLLKYYHPYEFLLFYDRDIEIEFNNKNLVKIN